MKTIKQLCALCLVLSFFYSCNEEETSYALQDVSAPTNVSATFDIAQDQSGMVSATPTADGATAFQIYFGDTEGETPTTIAPGETATHTYGEGTFTFRIVAVGLSGLTSELSRVVTISFDAPSDLAYMPMISESNPFEVTVTPSATNATVFDVYFGDVENEEATVIMAGESAVHVYEMTGDYTIRVVARGAGAATSESTAMVTIAGASDPITLPITFESATVNYAFESFGSAAAVVVDNPNAAGSNTSAKVGQLTKPAGAEVWAGALLTLENPIDFSTNKMFKMKVNSPKSGITVKLKLENLTDADISSEIDVVNTVANDWEELVFDFTAIDVANEYQKVVVFFDFGTPGDDTVYLFDDIQLVGAGANCTAETAENIDPMMGDINWTFKTNDAAHAFEPFGNITSEIVENPNPSGENTSCNVQSYVKTAGCEVWSGVGKGLANAIDLTTAANKQFSMLVYGATKTTEVTLRLEFEPHPNVDPSVDIVQTMTRVGEWEELTFDFSAHADKTFKSVIVYFDRNQPCDEAVYYFDDLKQIAGNTTTATEPTVAATAPTVAAANVISMFSDMYTDVTVDTWRTNWSMAMFEDVMVAGNAVKKYSELDFVGIEATSSTIDASAMTHFHVDVWSADFTEFAIKLVDFGPNGVFDENGDDTEHQINFTSPAQGEWISLDIPLSDFTGLTTKSHIAQLIFVGREVGQNTVYIDNVYFHN